MPSPQKRNPGTKTDCAANHKSIIKLSLYHAQELKSTVAIP